MFVRTTAINKIRKLKARKKVIQGGSSAGKTFGIIPILIDMAIKKPGLEVSVVSESVPHLKKGAMKDFKKIMKETGRWIRDHWHDTDRKYTFANDSYIEFFSPESILGARRNVLYINEANNVSYQDYHQLAIRTSDDIFIDYNPAHPFWAQEEVLKEKDSELLVLTYLDNEARPKNVDSEFEIARGKAKKEKEAGLPPTSYWQNWCKVYIDGEEGSLQGRVFQFNIVKEIPFRAELIAYGLDWGFSNDPTGLIKLCRFNGELFLQELIYDPGLTNSDIIKRMTDLGIPLRVPVVADSAEPKSIEDLRRGGFVNIQASKKGEDSIRSSIDTLQQFKINITEDSINAIKEFRNYSWATDKTGKSLNVPIDAFNHLIDPLRYIALNKLGKQVMFDID